MLKIMTTGMVIVLLVGLTLGSIFAAQATLALENQGPGPKVNLTYYQNVRSITLAGLLLSLGGLLWRHRREVGARTASETAALFAPRKALQASLGPTGSVKRRVFLTFIPGLGQVVVGRIARAIIGVVSLGLIWIGFFFLYSRLGSGQSYFIYPYLPVKATHITAVLCLTFGIWTLIAADAIRLNETGRRTSGYPAFRHIISTMALPIIPFASGILLQLVAGALLENTDYARLSGWAGACAGLFGMAVWILARSWGRTLVASVAGLFIGAACLILMVRMPVPHTGVILYRALVGGALVGLSLFLFLRGRKISALILPAVISASWIGVLTAFFIIETVSHTSLNPVLSPSILRSLTLVEFYFMGLAVLLVIQHLGPTPKSVESDFYNRDARVEGISPV
jgi:hypothetical protein